MERFSESIIWKIFPIVAAVLMLLCFYFEISNSISLRNALSSQEQEVSSLTGVVKESIHQQKLEGQRRVRDVNAANKRIDNLIETLATCKSVNHSPSIIITPYLSPAAVESNAKITAKKLPKKRSVVKKYARISP